MSKRKSLKNSLKKGGLLNTIEGGAVTGILTSDYVTDASDPTKTTPFDVKSL